MWCVVMWCRVCMYVNIYLCMYMYMYLYMYMYICICIRICIFVCVCLCICICICKCICICICIRTYRVIYETWWLKPMVDGCIYVIHALIINKHAQRLQFVFYPSSALLQLHRPLGGQVPCRIVWKRRYRTEKLSIYSFLYPLLLLCDLLFIVIYDVTWTSNANWWLHRWIDIGTVDIGR